MALLARLLLVAFDVLAERYANLLRDAAFGRAREALQTLHQLVVDRRVRNVGCHLSSLSRKLVSRTASAKKNAAAPVRSSGPACGVPTWRALSATGGDQTVGAARIL